MGIIIIIIIIIIIDMHSIVLRKLKLFLCVNNHTTYTQVYFKNFNNSNLISFVFKIFRHVRKITKIDYHLHHVCLSVRASAWNRPAATERTFMKFDI